MKLKFFMMTCRLLFTSITSIFLLSGCSYKDTELHNSLIHPLDDPLLDNHESSHVQVMWLGVSSLFLTDGDTTILIDPFVTRPNLITTLFGQLDPNEELVDEWIEKIQTISPDSTSTAVLVSHAHHDHAMDAALFADKTAAKLAGSPSFLNIASGAGFSASRMDDVKSQMRGDKAVFMYGSFRVTFLKSNHGLAIAGKVPFQGKVEQPIMPPLKLSDYRVGEVYSILVEHPVTQIDEESSPDNLMLLHHASASWKRGVLGEIDTPVDVVFLGIAGTDNYPVYIKQVVEIVDASAVVPFHYDDALRPLSKSFKVFPPVKFGDFVRATSECYPNLNLRILDWQRVYSFTPE